MSARKLCPCCEPMTEERRREIRARNERWTRQQAQRPPQPTPDWERPGYVPEGVEPIERRRPEHLLRRQT